jgi:CRISPR/Cas system-associated exonuclease Cas4 (RecB family)
LYLNRYKPKEKTPHDSVTMDLFNKGRDFEALFKAQFPEGIDLSLKLGKLISKYPSHTETLLENNSKITLFEAGIIHDDVLILTDVLVKEEQDFSIYEIKLSRSLSDTIKWDMALQYYICKSVLKNIKAFNVVLREEDNKFKTINLTDELEARQNDVKNNILKFKSVLASKSEPPIPMGPHCNKPYTCEFKAYCERSAGLFGSSI